jgi:hypothetical protein
MQSFRKSWDAKFAYLVILSEMIRFCGYLTTYEKRICVVSRWDMCSKRRHINIRIHSTRHGSMFRSRNFSSVNFLVFTNQSNEFLYRWSIAWKQQVFLMISASTRWLDEDEAYNEVILWCLIRWNKAILGHWLVSGTVIFILCLNKQEIDSNRFRLLVVLYCENFEKFRSFLNISIICYNELISWKNLNDYRRVLL